MVKNTIAVIVSVVVGFGFALLTIPFLGASGFVDNPPIFPLIAPLLAAFSVAILASWFISKSWKVVGLSLLILVGLIALATAFFTLFTIQ